VLHASLEIVVVENHDDARSISKVMGGVVLGISGKRGLWSALAAAADTVPPLHELNYGRLIKRAVDQCDRVEAKRLEVARNVLVQTSTRDVIVGHLQR
jgi:hypothetical protein